MKRYSRKKNNPIPLGFEVIKSNELSRMARLEKLRFDSGILNFGGTSVAQIVNIEGFRGQKSLGVTVSKVLNQFGTFQKFSFASSSGQDLRSFEMVCLPSQEGENRLIVNDYLIDSSKKVIEYSFNNVMLESADNLFLSKRVDFILKNAFVDNNEPMGTFLYAGFKFTTENSERLILPYFAIADGQGNEILLSPTKAQLFDYNQFPYNSLFRSQFEYSKPYTLSIEFYESVGITQTADNSCAFQFNVNDVTIFDSSQLASVFLPPNLKLKPEIKANISAFNQIAFDLYLKSLSLKN